MTFQNASFISAIPVLLLGVALVCFVIYCWVDIFRAEEVRHLPKWLWAVICIVSVPLGGIIYLVYGKSR
jgi:hypothetical protein